MAFEYTIKRNDYTGMGIVAGNWTATGVTAGVITTGFKEIIFASFSNAVANTNTTNRTGGTVLLTCTSGDSGQFLAYGQ
jgi:hypothetical protein